MLKQAKDIFIQTPFNQILNNIQYLKANVINFTYIYYFVIYVTYSNFGYTILVKSQRNQFYPNI